jgi:hypothetical protein
VSAPSPPISVPFHALEKPPPQGGASRQACHAGGHAGRATQSRAVREFQTPSSPHASTLHLNPPRRVGASHRVRPPLFHLRVLRVLRGLFFSVSSVFSVVCFFRALPTHLPLLNPMLCLVGAAQRFRSLFSTSVSSVVLFLRVLRVLCGLPSPCPPHPQSQPSPNLFPFPFQPLPNSPFLLLLLLSCMLKVKGAADALVGARTADGASPGQQRRRPQPLPSPDGGELRSLKPAAGGEQAGGGLLT